MKYVIVGAGIAGVTAAKTIRELDKNGEIVLIGKEQYMPYNRYRLTEYLCGTIDDDQLFYTSPEYWKEMNILFRTGEYVKSIDVSEKKIRLFHGEIMSYDKLLITTGACSTLGKILCCYKKYIQPFYTLEDVLLIKKKLPDVNQCVVTGEGLSTLDLICGLNNLKKKVVYITRMDKATFPLIESEFGGEIQEFLIDKGVSIISNDRIVSIHEKDSRYTVTTFQGHKLECNLVFASDDYKPNISVVQKTPIEKKWGILVDQHFQTSVEDVFAAGDCVEIYHPVVKDYWTNFGWPNALEQGKIAGRNMAGQQEEYKISEVIVFNLLGKSLKARWWE